jgi:hypothetical protein
MATLVRIKVFETILKFKKQNLKFWSQRRSLLQLYIVSRIFNFFPLFFEGAEHFLGFEIIGFQFG